MAVLREGMLLGMGNPLLDISANVNQDLLRKYQLKPNDAIMGDERHKELYTELVTKYSVTYTAGGATQNTLRVAQWILKKPKVAVFMGCVGKDRNSRILEDKAREDGVNVRYQYRIDEVTGTCAVLVTQTKGSQRSLCANLAAANMFTIDHIHEPENRAYIENAEVYYIAGFFLTVSPESALEIAMYASDKNRPFMMNLSAPFICQAFIEPLMQMMPYIDFIFGNETELAAFGKQRNYPTTDLKEIIKLIIKEPKVNCKRARIVIITQGSEPVLLGKGNAITEIPVPLLPDDKIVDTNGAGDAFVGGFLGFYLQSKPIEKCIDCALWAADHIIQQSGCFFDSKVSYPG